MAALPETTPIQSGTLANYTGLATPLAQSGIPTTTPTQSPVLVLQALPNDQDTSAKSELASFRYIWVVILLLLAAGILYMGWQVFKFSEWHFPPGH